MSNNMTNHLAILQRDNMRTFAKKRELSWLQVAEVSGCSGSTIRNNFGTGKIKNPPSEKTINKIEMAFDMPAGFLSRKHEDSDMDDPTMSQIVEEFHADMKTKPLAMVEMATVSLVADDGSFNIKMQVSKGEARKIILGVIGD